MRATASCTLLCLLLGSCATPDEIRIPGVELRDPLGLMDVVGELRLLVFTADVLGCDSATGTTTPSLDEDMAALFPDATVDLRFSQDEQETVNVDAGSYTILVRGWGTDPVSGRMNVIVATGCQTVDVGSGATMDVTIEMRDVVGEGVCMDGVLSPDEQCEPGTGPNPCVDCRTQSFVAHTTTEAMQGAPSVAWAAGGRLVLGFDSTEASFPGVRMMVRSETGELVTSPSALAVDAPVDVGAIISGAQTTTTVAASGAGFLVAFQDLSTAMVEGGDILARTFDANRTPAGPPFMLAPSAGMQANPSAAMLADGTALVAFEDATSSSGLSGRVVASGATSPSGDVFAIGASGGSAPDVSVAGSSFVVAFASAGNVFAQRFDASGAVMDATPIAVTEGGVGLASPAVAGLGDGSFFVVWQDPGAAEIRGRAFGADGAPVVPSLSVNTTPGAPAAPDVAGGADRFLVTWEDGGTVRGRLFDGAGMPARNREQPPTGDDFVLGSGNEARVATGGTRSGGTLAFVAYTSAGDVQGRVLPLP